jgi:hypothetical protein
VDKYSLVAHSIRAQQGETDMARTESTPANTEPPATRRLAGGIGGIASRIVMLARSRDNESAPRFAHEEITWRCSQRVVWIATHASEFVGIVEEHNGVNVANDTSRGTYNTYRTLADAMQAFESPSGALSRRDPAASCAGANATKQWATFARGKLNVRTLCEPDRRPPCPRALGVHSRRPRRCGVGDSLRLRKPCCSRTVDPPPGRDTNWFDRVARPPR